MPEAPKKKDEIDDKEPEPEKKDSWADDQAKREYYYDDAHGYEVYEPDNDEEDGEEESGKGSIRRKPDC